VAKKLADWSRIHARHCYEKHFRKSDRIESAWCYVQDGAFFQRWPKIMERARERDFAASKRANTDWIKIIDEIGGEGLDQGGKPSRFSVNQLNSLHEVRLGKWSVFTTNLSWEQIGQVYDLRIASRWLRGGNAIVDMSSVRDFNIRKLLK